MKIDINETMIQLKAVELMKRPSGFLFDTFCEDQGVLRDEKAVWDFKKGTAVMSPFVHKDTGGVMMARDSFESKYIVFPTLAPELSIEKINYETRSFGEVLIGDKTPAERANAQKAQDLATLMDMNQLRREWMVRQLLLYGKLDIREYLNNGRSVRTNIVADYSFTNNYTPASKWDQPDSDPDYDMEAAYDLVATGMGMVDIIIMAPDVKRALVNHASFMKKFDFRNANFGQISTAYRKEGLRYIGTNADGVDMLSLHGTFKNDNDVDEAMIPAGTVIVGSSKIMKMVHGPVTLLEGKEYRTYLAKDVPQVITDERNNAMIQRLTSRPMMIPFNVDAWAIMKVL